MKNVTKEGKAFSMTVKSNQSKVYVILKKQKGMLVGHSISNERPTKEKLGDIFNAPIRQPETPITENQQDAPKEIMGFLSLSRSFENSLAMYRDAVLSTIRISPLVSSMVVEKQLGRYVEKMGERLSDPAYDDFEVYELPHHSIGSVLKRNDQAIAAVSGAKHLTQISVIGLVSAYDAFLADLLRVIFTVKPELILTSDREIKFSDLTKFTSIEAIKENIIADEIEGVLRKSHHEQFQWMEKKFSMKLRDGLEVWPDFVELCERRNLLTHTGGVVSEQYIKNRNDFGTKSSARLGERLTVDMVYLENAIEVVAEIGLKLVHTMWRKFAESDRSLADSAINECGMGLIQIRKYKTAERILKFATDQKKHASDLVRRMMIVNLANACKLDGRERESKEILMREDWTATSEQFQICVAAVRDEHDKVCEILKLGPSITKITSSDFRDWPVFRSMRKVLKVSEVFREVYGEPLVRAVKVDLVEAAESLSDIENANDEVQFEINETVH